MALFHCNYCKREERMDGLNFSIENLPLVGWAFDAPNWKAVCDKCIILHKFSINDQNGELITTRTG